MNDAGIRQDEFHDLHSSDDIELWVKFINDGHIEKFDGIVRLLDASEM